MCVVYEKKGHIAYIKYDRPKDRNAFSPELIVKMARVLDTIDADNDVWVIILGSTTPGIFSAGMDLKLTIPLKTGARQPQDEYDHAILNNPDLFMRGALKAKETDRPIIAAIDGYCMAGGLEAVMSTDIRVATQRSSFALPEVKVGIVAAGGGLSKLARQIPYAKALEMHLTGRIFSAQEMLNLGFLNALVEHEEDLWPKAEEYAQIITENAPLAVRVAKQALKKCLGQPLEEALKIEGEESKRLRFTEDAREGPRAFVEKRKPRWKAK